MKNTTKSEVGWKVNVEVVRIRRDNINKIQNEER